MNRHLRPRLPLLKGQRGNCPLMSPLSGVPCVIQQRTIVTKLNDVNNEPLLRSSITSTANRKAESLFSRHSARTTSSIRTRRHHSLTNYNSETAPLNQTQLGRHHSSTNHKLWRHHSSTNRKLWRQHPSTNRKLWRQHSSTNDNSEGRTPQPMTTHVSGLSLLSRDQLAVHLLLFGELANPLLLNLLLDGDVTTGGSVDRGRHGWATSLSDKGNKRDVTYPPPPAKCKSTGRNTRVTQCRTELHGLTQLCGIEGGEPKFSERTGPVIQHLLLAQ